MKFLKSQVLYIRTIEKMFKGISKIDKAIVIIGSNMLKNKYVLKTFYGRIILEESLEVPYTPGTSSGFIFPSSASQALWGYYSCGSHGPIYSWCCQGTLVKFTWCLFCRHAECTVYGGHGNFPWNYKGKPGRPDSVSGSEFLQAAPSRVIHIEIIGEKL